jgi:hypothetical protein
MPGRHGENGNSALPTITTASDARAPMVEANIPHRCDHHVEGRTT